MTTTTTTTTTTPTTPLIDQLPVLFGRLLGTNIIDDKDEDDVVPDDVPSDEAP